MESYLELFENAIRLQSDIVGKEIASDQARKAGLCLTSDGTISSCTGNPLIVLLRLIRFFTEDKNLAALQACTPLINKLTALNEEPEIVS